MDTHKGDVNLGPEFGRRAASRACDAVWADTPRWAGSGFTRLVVELADLRGHPARAVARRHKALLESQLAEVLARPDVPVARERAREIWLLSEGAISLMLVHGDRGYAVAAAAAAKRLLTLPSQP